MHVTVKLPAPLRSCCEGAAALSLSASTVGEVLEQLENKFPALYRSICDETGAVRRHVNLFVNEDHMAERKGLDTPLVQGDVLSILPAVSGG